MHQPNIYRLHLLGRRLSQARNQLCLLPTCFMLVFCLAYSTPLTMEAIYFAETSVDFHRTTRHYILEDRTLNHHISSVIPLQPPTSDSRFSVCESLCLVVIGGAGEFRNRVALGEM
jgi:hypothetical protein